MKVYCSYKNGKLTVDYPKGLIKDQYDVLRLCKAIVDAYAGARGLTVEQKEELLRKTIASI